MGKFKMPTVQEFFKTKRIHNSKREPVWVFLERQMRLNSSKKPYNNKVANWLQFLKDLRYHYYLEAKEKYNRLCRECGPTWYIEFSTEQRRVLDNLKYAIREDVLADVPTRVNKSLRDLGVHRKIPKRTLMWAMAECHDDPGLFIWHLFTKLYKVPPSELLPKYDTDAKFLMSAIVFIDLDECKQKLNQLTTRVKPEITPTKKKKTPYFEPNVKYGQYLQKMNAPCYCPHTESKPKQPLPLAHKIKLKSDKSFEELAKKSEFLEKRKERNFKEQYQFDECKYKFWEPPPTLRDTDPTKASYNQKLKMFKTRACRCVFKYKPEIENAQYHITGVSYSMGKPVYIVQTMCTLPTGYMLINGGLSHLNSQFVTQINGMWDVSKESQECDCPCECMDRWDNIIENYLDNTKCYCGHFNDTEKTHERATETVFFPHTRERPFCLFDHVQIYKFDDYFDQIRDTVKVALASESSKSSSGKSSLEITELPGKELLKIFLADLLDTPLLLPHLPQANLLNNLRIWVKQRVKGNITPALHKQLLLKSERRWLDLKHFDFRAPAYIIPFTLKQLRNMTWAYRTSVQKLFKQLLANFEYRTRKNQAEQSRLWWPTMFYDYYPNKSFLEMYYTYMPCKYQDTYVLDPYSPGKMRPGGKTCPLKYVY